MVTARITRQLADKDRDGDRTEVDRAEHSIAEQGQGQEQDRQDDYDPVGGV